MKKPSTTACFARTEPSLRLFTSLAHLAGFPLLSCPAHLVDLSLGTLVELMFESSSIFGPPLLTFSCCYFGLAARSGYFTVPPCVTRLPLIGTLCRAGMDATQAAREDSFKQVESIRAEVKSGAEAVSCGNVQLPFVVPPQQSGKYRQWDRSRQLLPCAAGSLVPTR